MISDQKCPTCLRVYNPRKFGAGPKYCSPECRTTPKIGRHGEHFYEGRPGRPRRFPSIDDATAGKIVARLRQHGWYSAHPMTINAERRVVLTRGAWFSLKVCLGGGQRNEKWADAAAFFLDGQLCVESTCVKGRTVYNVVGRARARRVPCGSPECKKCRRVHTFLDLAAADPAGRLNLDVPGDAPVNLERGEAT